MKSLIVGFKILGKGFSILLDAFDILLGGKPKWNNDNVFSYNDIGDDDV